MTVAFGNIETVYDGIRFRSRVEARWACFFNALGIPWEYEPEGFQLSAHRRYLPDFLLPSIGIRGTFFEVKGADPTKAELRRCQDLSHGTRQRVALAVRAPFPPQLDAQPKSGSILLFFPDEDPIRGTAFFECPVCEHIDIAWPGVAYGCECEIPRDAEPSRTPRILTAYAAARSERFGT